MRTGLRRTAPALVTLLMLGLSAGPALVGLGGCTRERETVESAPAPVVSRWVVDAVGSAEAAWDAQLDPLRARAEQVQDDVARTAPLEAYGLDWSIGRYNIRPQTARAALSWAFAQDIAADFGYDHPPNDEEIVRDIMDAERAAVLVKVILAKLRDDHPVLRTLNWGAVEASDQAIAKLYSGYLGAGGAWEAWRSDTVPGDEAKQRLGCDADGSSCAVIQAHRPSGGG